MSGGNVSLRDEFNSQTARRLDPLSNLGQRRRIVNVEQRYTGHSRHHRKDPLAIRPGVVIRIT
jgi:hypothetical protein